MARLDSKRSRDSAARMAGGQTEMVKDLGNHPGLLNGGDDFQLATAVRAVFDVNIEHPFEQSSPANANRHRGMGRIVLRTGGILFVFLRVGNNRGTELGIRREHVLTNPSGTDFDREATRRGKYREVFHHCE